MTLEKRVENLENLVNGLIEMMNNNQFYTDSDIAGCRKGISDVTPYTTSATAYIGDTAVEFHNVPDGNMTVYVKDENGCPDYTVTKEGSTVIVSFEPLENVTEVTLSII